MIDSGFDTPLDVRLRNDGKFMVLSEFVYHVGGLGTSTFIRVPRGFVTDFASVPKFLHPILPKVGTHGKAAVLHDWLYHLVRKGELRRVVADAMFLEAMQTLKVPIWKNRLLYYGVRLGGWASVKKKNPWPALVDPETGEPVAQPQSEPGQ